MEIATVRELESFAAQFLLTDDGELKSILLDEQTLADLGAHEYPILNSARTQSYADFNSSETDSKAEHVLYDALAQKHIDAWDDRDQRLGVLRRPAGTWQASGSKGINHQSSHYSQPIETV